MSNSGDTTEGTGSVHVVEAACDRIAGELTGLAEAPVWSMDAATAARCLTKLTALVSRAAELELRVANQAAVVEVEDNTGATSTAAWWAHSTRITRHEAYRKTKLAGALDSDLHQPVRVALADGLIRPDQAAVIVAAVDALPADLVEPEVFAKAETTLLDYAAVHDAKTLRILGKRILDVVAPEVGDAHEARLLAAEEREAEKAKTFSMREDGHGKAHGRFTIPTADAATLKKLLMAFAAAKHQTAQGKSFDPQQATRERMGEAFCELIATYPRKHTPRAGGVNATVVVTMDLDTFTGESQQPATTDTDERVSPGLARRLACEAGIIPAVLGGDSVVLDLGRTRRFHTEKQRIALMLQQGGCIAEGCDRPPSMCHVHHDEPWSRGGGTSVKDGSLLCSPHHTRIHDPTYRAERLANGKVRFHRRT